MRFILLFAALTRALFFLRTHYAVNINGARRVHRKASESFLREIFRCIFTGRDFLKYIAHFCTILLYESR